LDFLDPYVETGSQYFLSFINYTNFSLPTVLFIIAFLVRSSFIPLLIHQTKKITLFSRQFLFYKEIFDVYKNSKYSELKKIPIFLKLTRKFFKKINFKPLRLLLLNISHFPLLILTILTIRRTLASEQLSNTSFLWISNVIEMDPYYILPFFTCAIYYYNFGKGVTPLTKHSFFGRFRYFLQVCMILWFPMLSHWPSAIVFYIMCNSIISTIQMKISNSPFFFNIINPEFMVGMQLLSKTRNNEKNFHKVINDFLPYDHKNKIEEDHIEFTAKQEIEKLKKIINN
jgi:membrane protein insertase Oxa1/YidC/SpoIIIJ